MASQGSGHTDDLAKLPRLDTGIILQELNHRYTQDKIYTYVGDILIAVNPFKTLNIYNKNASNKYKEVVKSSAPPHIFAVADTAYQAMLGKGGAKAHNQCCVISGESGAGKTENAKFIISQIIELSQGKSALEQQILQPSGHVTTERSEKDPALTCLRIHHVIIIFCSSTTTTTIINHVIIIFCSSTTTTTIIHHVIIIFCSSTTTTTIIHHVIIIFCSSTTTTTIIHHVIISAPPPPPPQ
ncbi:hypothetical protein QZH41_013634 [Actinostola sp. cb2023]|nr:hypothetical protein QZH41_013634 [Actinostola sp. cb2023]